MNSKKDRRVFGAKFQLIPTLTEMISNASWETLKSLIIDLKTRGVDFYTSEVKDSVMDVLAKVALIDELGEKNFHSLL